MVTQPPNMPRPYEKPRITREATMHFPQELLEGTAQGLVCRQCSSCHGCR